MKAFKIISITLFSFFIAIYLAFLFVLPNAIDLNKYSPQITQAIEKNTGFKVQIQGLKVQTAWNLSAGASIEKMDLKYPTGVKFAQLNDLKVKLSLLPLFIGNLRVDSVELGKIMLNADIKNNGKFLIEDYLLKSPVNQEKSALKLSDKMPRISVEKYRISFVDMKTNKTYSIKGSDFVVSDFVLNKKIKLATKGDLFLKDRKQISYNVALFSKVPFEVEKKPASQEKIDIIKILENLYNYNVKADIIADLKASGSADEPQIDGKVNLNDISFVIGAKTFPASTLGLEFEGDKVKINSKLYTDVNSKASITGTFKNGRKRAIDLRVVTSQTSLSNVVYVANTILKTFGKNDLEGISANGILKADFNIKSDFKKIKSSGYLKVQNASVAYKLYNVAVKNINADVDFSENSIHINKATASLNNQPITVHGQIDKNANADITVLANSLQLKGLLLASGNTALLKDNDIQGVVSAKISVKGRLDKVKPEIGAVVSNVAVRNKPSKTNIKIAKIVANISSDKKGEGTAQILGLKALPAAPAVVSAQKILVKFNEKDLDIEPAPLYISGIKTILAGRVSGLNSTPKLNNVGVSVPNQVSVPIAGYPGSKIILKGDVALNGSLENPQIDGSFSVPLVKIPTLSTNLKNTTISFNKDITINCAQMQVANSFMGFNAIASKDFSHGFVVKNVNFTSSNIDLDTLAAAMANMPKGSNSDLGIIVSGGRASVARFKVGQLVANNITSSIALHNNILDLNNLQGDAYLGKIKGRIGYDVIGGRAKISVGGRGMSASPALKALSGRDDGIVGTLNFDSNISLRGTTEREIMNSLAGNVNFIILNGKMGVLGKFEHLLYAQNIISNNVLSASLNVVAKALTLKNTGVYKYMKGKMFLSNGWANIQYIKTSGPSMAMYITGRYYIPGNTASITILGRISDDVVRVLGPIGEFSVDRALSSIPKIGPITAFLVNQFTTNPNYENTDLIPDLTPKTQFDTKAFKVVIDGNIQRQNSVKSFKWISKPRAVQTQPQVSPQRTYTSTQKTLPTSIPDFVNKLPEFLN